MREVAKSHSFSVSRQKNRLRLKEKLSEEKMDVDNNAPSKLLPGEMVGFFRVQIRIGFSTVKVHRKFSVTYVTRNRPVG